MADQKLSELTLANSNELDTNTLLYAVVGGPGSEDSKAITLAMLGTYVTSGFDTSDQTARDAAQAAQTAADTAQATADAALPKTGGTMTGFITLHADPTADKHAAPKDYVDDEFSKAVPKAGGTMTGFLTLSGTPTADKHAAPKDYVDSKVSGISIPTVPAKASNNDVDTETDDSDYMTVLKTFRAIARKVKNASNTVRGIVLLARNEDVASTETDTTRIPTIAHVKTLITRLFLPLTGGTLTGKLTLDGDPTSDLHASTKAYADFVASLNADEIETLKHITRDLHTIDDPPAWSDASDSDGDIYAAPYTSGTEVTLSDTDFNGNGASFTIPQNAQGVTTPTIVYIRLRLGTDLSILALNVEDLGRFRSNVWSQAGEHNDSAIPTSTTHAYYLVGVFDATDRSIDLQLEKSNKILYSEFAGLFTGEIGEGSNVYKWLASLAHLTSDLYAPKGTDGWVKPSDDTKGGICLNDSPMNHADIDGKGDSDYAVEYTTGFAGKYLGARIPDGADPAFYRIRITGTNGSVVFTPLTNYYSEGADTASGNWDLYISDYWTAVPGNSVAKLTLEYTETEDHAGTSRFRGGLSGQKIYDATGLNGGLVDRIKNSLTNWNNTTTYSPEHLVVHTNQIWIALKLNINKEPGIDTASNWATLVNWLSSTYLKSGTVNVEALKKITVALADRLIASIGKYSATATYAADAMVVDAEFIWVSQKDSNMGNSPATDDGTNWVTLAAWVKANSGGTGDDNVQSDWDQTDDTADDYVKNKPTTITGTPGPATLELVGAAVDVHATNTTEGPDASGLNDYFIIHLQYDRTDSDLHMWTPIKKSKLSTSNYELQLQGAGEAHLGISIDASGKIQIDPTDDGAVTNITAEFYNVIGAKGDKGDAGGTADQTARDAAQAAQAAADAAKTVADAALPKAGGTLTDFLTLHAEPTADKHAAPKDYVDDNVISSALINTSGHIILQKGDGSTFTVSSFEIGMVLAWASGSNYRVIGRVLRDPHNRLFMVIKAKDNSTTPPAEDPDTFKFLGGIQIYADGEAFPVGAFVTDVDKLYRVNTAVPSSNTTNPASNSSFTEIGGGSGGVGAQGPQGAFYLELRISASSKPDKPTALSYNYDDDTFSVTPTTWKLKETFTPTDGERVWEVRAAIDPRNDAGKGSINILSRLGNVLPFTGEAGSGGGSGGSSTPKRTTLYEDTNTTQTGNTWRTVTLSRAPVRGSTIMFLVTKGTGTPGYRSPIYFTADEWLDLNATDRGPAANKDLGGTEEGLNFVGIQTGDIATAADRELAILRKSNTEMTIAYFFGGGGEKFKIVEIVPGGGSSGGSGAYKHYDSLPDPDSYEINDLIEFGGHSLILQETYATADTFAAETGTADVHTGREVVDKYIGIANADARDVYAPTGLWTSNPGNEIAYIMEHDGTVEMGVLRSAYRTAKGSNEATNDVLKLRMTINSTTETLGLTYTPNLDYESESFGYRTGYDYLVFQGTVTGGGNFVLQSEGKGQEATFIILNSGETSNFFTHDANAKHWVLYHELDAVYNEFLGREALQKVNDAILGLNAVQSRVRALDFDFNEAPKATVTIDGDTVTDGRKDPAWTMDITDVEAQNDILVIEWENFDSIEYTREHALPGSTDAEGRMYIHLSDELLHQNTAYDFLGRSVNPMRVNNGDGTFTNVPTTHGAGISIHRTSTGFQVQITPTHAEFDSSTNVNNLQPPANFSMTIKLYGQESLAALDGSSLRTKIDNVEEDVSIIETQLNGFTLSVLTETEYTNLANKDDKVIYFTYDG